MGKKWRKVNYNKGIREIYWIRPVVKTNPIQTQSLLAPSTAVGLKTLFEKTKPICFVLSTA